MDKLVFAPSLDSKTREAYYASAIPGTTQPCGDLVERILRNAKKAKFKVFLGLNVHDDWWSKGADDADWLLGQMREGNVVSDELYAQYHKRYPTTFVGWYWVWEAENLRFNKPSQRETLARAIETNVAHVKTLNPRMPVMLCPFMNYMVGKPRANAELWEYVFAHTSLGKGDIFGPQDCVGAGGLKIDNFVEWFKELRKAVDTKPGLLFWSDAETFVQKDWSSAPLSRFVTQLKGAQPIVDEIITFAYSHYYSPNNANPAWQRAFERYVRKGALDTTPPPPPTNVTVTRKDGKITFSWRAEIGRNGDCGFEVLRGGRPIGKVQIPKEARKLGEVVTLTLEDTVPDAIYQIRAFDVVGTVSAGVACH